MIGKIIALIAVVAVVASAELCGICGGYLTTGYGSRVLNAGCPVSVVSAVPACSPVAVPTQVVDPIPTSVVAAPVVSTGLVSSGLCGSGVYGYGGYGYGSTLGGCGSGILSVY